MTKGKPYEVGYKKPPTKTQYKKGDRGNPQGRPKGTKNLKTDLAEELSELTEIRENGKTQIVSKQRLLLKTVMARGIQGDQKAASNIFSLATKLLMDEAEPDTGSKLDPRDREIFEDYVRRYAERQARESKASE